MKVHNDISCVLDIGNCVILLMLDLSAAFDSMDHKILLSILSSRFGIHGKTLSWLESYLTDRIQCVTIDGIKLTERELVHSEKSPARPMLFYSTNYWHQF